LTFRFIDARARRSSDQQPREHLWLGIYQASAPAERPWSYIFLAIVLLMFAIDAAGRSLGLDAWLRHNVPAVRDGTGFIGKLLRLAG
jgi:hypothetical protein